MIDEEARTIINILFEADHGCPYCAASLLKKFIKKFPTYEQMIRDKFITRFKDNAMYDVDNIWNEA